MKEDPLALELQPTESQLGGKNNEGPISFESGLRQCPVCELEDVSAFTQAPPAEKRHNQNTDTQQKNGGRFRQLRHERRAISFRRIPLAADCAFKARAKRSIHDVVEDEAYGAEGGRSETASTGCGTCKKVILGVCEIGRENRYGVNLGDGHEHEEKNQLHHTNSKHTHTSSRPRH